MFFFTFLSSWINRIFYAMQFIMKYKKVLNKIFQLTLYKVLCLYFQAPYHFTPHRELSVEVNILSLELHHQVMI